MPNYELVDCEAKSRSNPVQWPIPTSMARRNVAADEWVQLGFMQDGKMELLLVRVDDSEYGQDIYYGKLDQKPKMVKLTIGDPIQFSSKNIFRIVKGE